ncbi:MAG: methionyl-tRNA formyltransferase [Woeseiaceae bacterium]|nr:methionyl-tRNA formyltransferase [Woeseiaceae bacterium]
MTNLRVLFAGTPEFALASLTALVDAGIKPVAVMTQPDRPAGRGKRLSASPVKRFALEQDIDVLQPETLRDADVVVELAALSPDIVIVAAYGLILPQDVLDIPQHGCLNVHASLLPRWRGAAPIQAAILNGDTETGVSLMSMTAGLDCGPVYATQALAIGNDETAGELHDRLAGLGAELLLRNLAAIVNGDLEAVAQDDSQGSYAAKIGKQDAVLDWHRSAQELKRLVRAYNPVPGAWFDLDGQRIKCWQVSMLDDVDDEAGKVVSSGRRGIIVACGDGGLILESLQRPGKRPVTGAEFSAAVNLADRTLSVPE